MSTHGKNSPHSVGSLTPASRSNEVAEAASQEGYFNAMLTLFPASGALYFAMQNPTFVKRTNWQSRTALVVMPVLFVFALTSEKKLEHRMREIAAETRHNQATVHWAEEQTQSVDEPSKETHLLRLYQQSIADSGVNIVPELKTWHKAANYAADHPFKLLASLAIPSVALIFYGRTGKEHLEFSHKLLHTRVFGQFTTLSILLGVMGFKELMDRNGKYISQQEADQRLAEMKEVRARLMDRLAYEKQHAAEIKRTIAKAHEDDLHDKRLHAAHA